MHASVVAVCGMKVVWERGVVSVVAMPWPGHVQCVLVSVGQCGPGVSAW